MLVRLVDPDTENLREGKFGQGFPFDYTDREHLSDPDYSDLCSVLDKLELDLVKQTLEEDRPN